MGSFLVCNRLGHQAQQLDMQLPLLSNNFTPFLPHLEYNKSTCIKLLGIKVGGLKWRHWGAGYCLYTCSNEGRALLHKSLKPHRSEKLDIGDITLKCHNLYFQEKCKSGASDGQSWMYSFCAVYKEWASDLSSFHAIHLDTVYGLTRHCIFIITTISEWECVGFTGRKKAKTTGPDIFYKRLSVVKQIWKCKNSKHAWYRMNII